MAQSATTGTFRFYVDDVALTSGLPYAFADADLQFAWVSGWATNALAETKWDDLEVSTIPTLVSEEDHVLYRSGSWFNNLSDNGFGALPGGEAGGLASFGVPWAKPMIGDINGDGMADMVVAQTSTAAGDTGGITWVAAHSTDLNSNGIIEMSKTTTSTKGYGTAAGNLGNMLGDYNGDGIQDIMTINTGYNWFGFNSTTAGLGTGVAQPMKQLGALSLNDVPFSGDFNGDGMDDIGVWRPGSGGTFVSLTGGTLGSGVVGTGNGGANVLGAFGNANFDTPLVGDINGDGRDDLILVATGLGGLHQWIAAFGQADGTLSYAAEHSNQIGFGIAGDVPMLADLNGDGMDDLIVVRNSGSYFATFTEAGGVLTSAVDSTQAWGTIGDVPVFGQLNTEIILPLIIGNIAVGQLPSGLELTWTTRSGYDYQLQIKTNLTDISWSSNATYSATGESMTVTTAVDQAHSFYRVIMEEE